MSNIDLSKIEGYIWMNGKQVPWKDAQLHFLTHSLHYGSALFEGIRAYNGKPFKVREHMQRLLDGAKFLEIDVPYTVDQLVEAAEECLKLNKLTDAYLRPLVWRGAENWGIGGDGTQPNVAIASWSIADYFDPDSGSKTKGIAVKTAPWKRPSPETAPSHVKANGLYMICTLSKHEALRAGYNDALMLDYRGHVAELSCANLFMVKNGELHTPTPDCFLNGITRQTIIDLAKQKGIAVHVRTILPEELETAEEVFATGTAIEIQPIGKINHTEYTVGPVTHTLMDAYHQLVRS